MLCMANSHYQFIKAPETELFTFEAVLFLSILADFHKSDAAKLNPYLSRIKDSNDQDLMRKMCWSANFALGTSVKFAPLIVLS